MSPFVTPLVSGPVKSINTPFRSAYNLSSSIHGQHQHHFTCISTSASLSTTPTQHPYPIKQQITSHFSSHTNPQPTLKMKFTLFTLLVAALFSSLVFTLVIPSAVLSTNAVSAREPALSVEDDNISAAVDADATVEARDNGCGSSPYENPACSAGNNLKIGKGMVAMSVLGVVAAGCLF